MSAGSDNKSHVIDMLYIVWALVLERFSMWFISNLCSSFLHRFASRAFSPSQPFLLFFHPLIQSVWRVPRVERQYMTGFQGYASHVGVIISRWWLVIVEAPGCPRHHLPLTSWLKQGSSSAAPHTKLHKWFQLNAMFFAIWTEGVGLCASLIKLINSRWVWKLVPKRLVEPGSNQPWGRRYPWQPCKRATAR